jgi:REP element-mobilizing transposase RayT
MSNAKENNSFKILSSKSSLPLFFTFQTQQMEVNINHMHALLNTPTHKHK